METRRIFRYWSLLNTVFIVVSAVAIPVCAQQTRAAAPQGVPADHYDPDDLKTYEDVVTEDRSISIRGHELIIHFYRSQSSVRAVPVIYACGDGGWRGLAPRTAQQLAHFGFAVAGLDSKVYLREASSSQDPLTIAKLASDYAKIASLLRAYARIEDTVPVYVYGWSLGAGFAIAVGSDALTRPNWAGIVAIGLPAQNQLVSGLGANHANLKDTGMGRYGFRTESVIPDLSPIPLVLIESSSDSASPQRIGRELFAAAGDPKRYFLIKADNHRFSGARNEFYAALMNAMLWIQQTRGTLSQTTLRGSP